MTRRFGGAYSPSKSAVSRTGATAHDAAMVAPGDRVRSGLLFLLPLPLALRAFGREPAGLAMTLAAFGLIICGALLTRAGLQASAQWEARKVARRPAFPRKICAALLIGTGVTLAALTGSGGVIGSVTLGLTGAICHLAAFGLDPMRDKGMEGVDRFQAGRVARVVGGGEDHLEAMNDAILRAGDPELERRVADFSNTARRMFRTVEDDPHDLSSARKYLSVYLRGARDATQKFADLSQGSGAGEARATYVALLADLETHFTARTEKLLADGQDDLDVEIDVLRERLARDAAR